MEAVFLHQRVPRQPAITNDMKKPTTLTYGFELEGFTDDRLTEQLKKLGFTGGYDGSVNGRMVLELSGKPISYHSSRSDGNTIVTADYASEHVSCGVMSELRSPVFKDREKMLAALSIFSGSFGKLFVADRSCGLHLHIGGSTSDTRRMLSYRLIKRMQLFATKHLCIHIKNERMVGNRYAIQYTGSYVDTANRIATHNKYQFVRNHPQGTLEFRFFSACEHMSENVTSFLDELDAAIVEVSDSVAATSRLDNVAQHDEIKSSFTAPYGDGSNIETWLPENVKLVMLKEDRKSVV